jgi:hypothetical protein
MDLDSSQEEVGPTIGDTSPIEGVQAATFTKVSALQSARQQGLNLFKQGLQTVISYTPRDALPPVETPPKVTGYTLSSVTPPENSQEAFQLLPFSEGFKRAFSAFQEAVLEKGALAEKGKGECDSSFITSLAKPIAESSVYFNKYNSLQPVMSDTMRTDSSLAPLLSKGSTVDTTNATVPQATLRFLEGASRKHLNMASYMDWGLAATQKAAKDLASHMDSADALSNEFLEMQRISKDLVALTTFCGQILQDFVPCLVNMAANITNMRRDSVLAQVNPALPQKWAINLRASNYLGPQLFEPGLVQIAQDRLNKRLKARGQDTLVRSMVNVAKAVSKRPSGGQQPQGGKQRKTQTAKPDSKSNQQQPGPSKPKNNTGFRPRSNKGKGRGKGKSNQRS